MADDGSKEGATWPMPKFRFEVNLGNELNKVAFQEVSGMDVENQIASYRPKNEKELRKVTAPEQSKNLNVTLKKGVFPNQASLQKLKQQISENMFKPKTITIRMVHENGKTEKLWELKHARPTKIRQSNLKSEGNEVAVDTIEIAHEQLTITNSKP